MNFTILTHETLDSTNTEALKQAKLGAGEGLCIVAREQTAGRGRHGRTWISAKDAGLYFSIVLRPDLDAELLPLITLMAGAAVHETLAEMGVNADIKWVNDLLVNDKKIGGILAETTDTTNGLAVIVGIGINLRSSSFPPEVAATSTSVDQWLPQGVDNSEIIQKLTANLARFYEMLGRADGPAEIIDEWRKRSSYFMGKRIRVTTGREPIAGITDGLEKNGALRLKRPDGSIAVIQSGEVERLRVATD